MSEAAARLDKEIRWILLSQLALSILATLVFAVYTGWPSAGAALYGGCIAVLSALWMGYRIQHVGDKAKLDPTSGAIMLYGGAILKFVFAIAAFAVGMGVLKLIATPIIVGFAVPQLAYLVAPLGACRT